MGKERGAQSLWKTLKGYAERGWEVFFITGNHAQGAAPDLPDNIRVIRFDARWLKRVMQVRKIGFFAKLLWWLYFQVVVFVKAQWLRFKYKFDIVYGYEIAGVPVAKLLSKLWRIPMVSRFQGTSFGVDGKGKRVRFLRAWDHVVGLRIPADLVIMTNDGTQGDQVLQTLGVNMARVRFWMNGVDWELLKEMPEMGQARRALNVESQHVLLVVSRLASWKCVDRSIQALPHVLRELSSTILIVVGDGPERERLERLALQLGVRDHVRFEGAVPHSEVPKYLASADIFLSLYEWSNVGNPLLEAMMAGKCIITLNNGDTARVVKNGDNGILLEYEELPKLPEAIRKLLVDKELRQRLGANARKFAEEHFWSWEERIEEEITEVCQLLGRESCQ